MFRLEINAIARLLGNNHDIQRQTTCAISHQPNPICWFYVLYLAYFRRKMWVARFLWRFSSYQTVAWSVSIRNQWLWNTQNILNMMIINLDIRKLASITVTTTNKKTKSIWLLYLVMGLMSFFSMWQRRIQTWTHQTALQQSVNISFNCFKFIYQLLVSNRLWLLSKQCIGFITVRNVPINRTNPKHVFQTKYTELFAIIR